MRKSSSILMTLATVVCSTVRTWNSAMAADIAVVSVVEGDRGPGFKPAANVMGAVGPKHVVNFTIAGFTVRDKSTGKSLRHQSQLEFWHQVQPARSLDPSPHANDPWMVYDPLSERWFATIAGTGTGESYLAVSSSADPMDPWRGVSLPLPRHDPGLKIGVDRNGVYISCANGGGNPKEALDLYAIPKVDAIDKKGPILTRAQTLPKLIYAAFPAVNFDKNQKTDTPAVLLNNAFGGPECSELYLHRINWSDGRAAISKIQPIPLSRTYAVPRMEGIQPEGGVRLTQAGGRRNNCAFVRGGSVFSCNGAQRTADSRPGILWYEVRIKDGALLQEGFVDSPECDYLYPSIAVDERGNIGIGCTRTSKSDYPSVCVMMHAAGDAAGTMRPPVVAVKGTTVYRHPGATAMNFSNYSTTCIDPSDSDLLWTYQGYTNSKIDRQWCTAWAAFRLPAEDRHKADNKPTTVPSAIPPTAPRPTAGKTADPKQPRYKSFDHVIKAAPPARGEHKFRLVVPDGLEVVRGILVVGPYSGGDSRDYHEQVWYREFLNLHGFAFLGATNYYLHDYTVMQAALKQFAADSEHPELVNAPYAATGFSAGGGYTRKLMHADPDKIIAGVVVGSTMKLPGQLTDAHRRVPMCVINGELERDPGQGPGMAKHLEPVLAEHRPKGALWGWMAVQGVGHEFAGQEVLTMPILDAAIRLRYPTDGDVRKGPVKLKTVELESGWVADNTTWKRGLTSMAPAMQFKGDVAKSSWLLNEDVAFIYRAYSTLDWPLKITSPGREAAKHEVFDAGSTASIVVDDSKFAGWKRLELYDGATKMDELAKGPARFTVKDLKPGFHAYSVLGTDGKGNVRPSNPVLVVVR